MRQNGAVTDHAHQVEELREAASALRERAAAAETEIETLLRDHPEDAGFWTGPTATTFYDVTGDVRRRLTTAAGDLRDYAAALDARADELERSPHDGGSA